MQIQAVSPGLQRPFQPPPTHSLGFSTNSPFKSSFLTPTKHAPSYPFHFLHSVKSRSIAAVIATDEKVVIHDDSANEPGFVNIGYVSSVHGLHGEIRVKPSTDFPQLRFSTVLFYLFIVFVFFCGYSSR